MAAKDRRLRRIDERLPFSGGADILSVAGEVAPPAPPTIPAPQFLAVIETYLELSAVTPRAGVRLSWQPPVNGGADSYQIQWATDSAFTSPTTLTAGAGQTTADVPGLPVNVGVWFRIRGVLRLVTGAWSNTASVTTPNDTTPPDAPTALVTSWSGLTGDLTITWANPVASPNFRDVRLQIYASNGGVLLREVYDGDGRYVWTRAQNYADTSNSPDASVYLVLTARSWSNVFSATNLTGTATLAAPAAPSGLAVDFAGADLGVSWTMSALIAGYRLTLDGQQRDVGLSNRYTYTFAANAAEHGGTPDPSIAVSLVAVDALGQTSTAAATTATNAAPAAPSSVTVTALLSTLSIGVTATEPIDFRAYRYRLVQTSPSAPSVTWESLSPLQTRPLIDDATYQLGVRVVDIFGQVSAETLSAVVVADVLTTDELRAEAIYSNSIGTSGATLKAALADEDPATTFSYADSGLGWRWTQIERPFPDRYLTVSFSAATTIELYLAFSADGVTWRWFAGPLTLGRLTVEVVSEAAAQASPVNTGTTPLTGTRIDLPATVEARFIRMYHRKVGSSYTFRLLYPRRLVQTDDLQVEAVQAIHIAAGAITAEKISVGSLSTIDPDLGTITGGSLTGVTITGATIQTATSGARVELTSANGLRTLDSGGNPLVSLTGSGGLTINSDASYSSSRAVRWTFSGLETRQSRQGSFYSIEHEVTSISPGNILLSTINTSAATAASIRISQDPINTTGFGNSVTISGYGLRVGSAAGDVALGDISAGGSVSASGGLNVGFASGAAAGTGRIKQSDAGTSDTVSTLLLQRSTSGTVAAGFGTAITFQLESGGTEDRNMAQVRATVADATNHRGRVTILAGDTTTLREGFRVESNGSAPLISMYGVAAVARQTIAAAATDLATAITLVNDIRTKLINLGAVQA